MSVWRLRDMKSAAYRYRKGTNNLQVLSPNPIGIGTNPGTLKVLTANVAAVGACRLAPGSRGSRIQDKLPARPARCRARSPSCNRNRCNAIEWPPPKKCRLRFAAPHRPPKPEPPCAGPRSRSVEKSSEKRPSVGRPLPDNAFPGRPGAAIPAPRGVRQCNRVI